MCIIVIIDEYYFDLTDYCKKHPGGERILQKYHLKDATSEFNAIKGHGDEFAISQLDDYCIGPIKKLNIDLYLHKNYTS